MCLSRYHKHIKFYKGNKRIFFKSNCKMVTIYISGIYFYEHNFRKSQQKSFRWLDN